LLTMPRNIAVALGGLVLLVLTTAAVMLASSTAYACSFEMQISGECTTAVVGDGAVDLGATIETPASSGLGSNDNSAESVAVEALVEPVESVGESWCDLQRLPCVPWTPPAEVDAAGPITMSDIATFRPQPPTAGMQPNQWMVVGLDTNFFANASTHVVDGILFGGTAQVRFTPVAYYWDYGDGHTANLSTAGTTWAKYKVPEFDPTPTSHIYDASGNYTVTATITYAAEYRVAGSSWNNVIGTLSITAPPLTATAGHATTVLVDQNCNTNPTGIGC